MKKLHLTVIVVVTFLTLALLAVPALIYFKSPSPRAWFSFSSVTLVTSGEIPPRDVDVKVTSTEMRGRLTRNVIVAGKQEDSMPQVYGKYHFEVFVRGESVMEFSHFSTNNWHEHHFTIRVAGTWPEVEVSAEVAGPDASDWPLERLPFRLTRWTASQ